MHTQYGKVIFIVAFLLSFGFISLPSKGNDILKDIQEKAKNFISSFSVKGFIENLSPTTIAIVLCMATPLLLGIVFRGLVFIVIMIGILIMMFGSVEKATDFFKEKFSFRKTFVIR